MSQKHSIVIGILGLLLPLLGLLIFSYSSNVISTGDTNVYFYTAYQMLQGKQLYNDIVFTNLPLFPLISVIYFKLTGGNIYHFYFTEVVEVVILAILIFYAVYFQTRRYLAAIVSTLLFSFSVYNLIHLNYQTGVVTASLLSVVAYVFIKKKKPLLVGLSMSFCFLTKAYFIPILIALVYLSFTEFKLSQIKKMAIGLLLGLIPLIPYLINSSSQMFYYLYDFSLKKAASFNKFRELRSFLSLDFGMVLLFLLSFPIKSYNRKFWLVLLLLFSLYFLVISDFPYIYFGMIMPFLSIRIGHLTSFLLEKSKNPSNEILLLIFILPLLLFNILQYRDFLAGNKIFNVDEVISLINQFQPERMYGVSSVTPALAYITDTPLFDNMIDVNPRFFEAGILDKKNITKDVVTHKTITVFLGFENKYQSGNNLLDYVDKDVFIQNCEQIKSFPIVWRPPINRIVLYGCSGQF